MTTSRMRKQTGTLGTRLNKEEANRRKIERHIAEADPPRKTMNKTKFHTRGEKPKRKPKVVRKGNSYSHGYN